MQWSSGKSAPRMHYGAAWGLLSLLWSGTILPPFRPQASHFECTAYHTQRHDPYPKRRQPWQLNCVPSSILHRGAFKMRVFCVYVSCHCMLFVCFACKCPVQILWRRGYVSRLTPDTSHWNSWWIWRRVEQSREIILALGCLTTFVKLRISGTALYSGPFMVMLAARVFPSLFRDLALLPMYHLECTWCCTQVLVFMMYLMCAFAWNTFDIHGSFANESLRPK